MIRVGLTGGIGSGKSLVCSILDRLGIPVYKADAEARRLMNDEPLLRTKIVESFGDQAYENEGLNREFLATQVFGDAKKLELMNSLVHPAVREDFLKWADQHREYPYVVEEAAILFESGAFREMDQTVLVTAPEELRIKRVMERDGSEREAVLKRMGHQRKEEELLKLADHVIVNDGEQMLLPQVIDLHNKLLKADK